ncbi:MAG: RND transporter, partial [Chitinophagaceae bacterium]
MWKSLAKFVLKNKVLLLVLLTLTTAVMGFFASKIKLSYEFARAIPTDNPKYKDYQDFKATFGDDGNTMVIGTVQKDLFTLKNFEAYCKLNNDIKKVRAVEDVLSVPGAINLQKDSLGERLQAVRIFPDSLGTQTELDSAASTFHNLPFYRDLMYNPATNAYMMAVRLNREIINSKERTVVIQNIRQLTDAYATATGTPVHLSGLPLIRTVVSDRIQSEMKIFLIGSLLLSVLILLVFFRSVSTTLLSMAVVIIGVVWSVGIMQLMGYQISLLTALIPSLVVVIGIPNCIYFINKYHTSYLQSGDKEQSLIDMVSKMGVVTLFCNITAAIGFAVFALTRSAILKEFGAVAGISIMLIFVVSFILLPAVLSLLPVPKEKELKYLHSKWVHAVLAKLEYWVFNYKKQILGITAVLLVISGLGIMRLQTLARIVDDLPKEDIIYKDLKFFESNFKGVMPLEIVLDSKKRRGLSGMRALNVYSKLDSLAQFIAEQPNMRRPLGVGEGLKFAKQGFYEGDSFNYALPNSFDGAFVGEYLRPSKDGQADNNFSRMLRSFVDTASQRTRLSVSMADVGTQQLPRIL